MTRTKRAIAIAVALAIGFAALKLYGACPPEDFESFAAGAVATDIIPGVTITVLPGSCPGGVDPIIVELGDTSSPSKALGIEPGCPNASPDYLRLEFDEPQPSVSFTLGEQLGQSDYRITVRGFSPSGSQVWTRTMRTGTGTHMLVKVQTSTGVPIKRVEVDADIDLFETLDDLRFGGDTTPPIVEIDAPLSDACLTGSAVNIFGEVDDPDGAYGCDTLAYRLVDANPILPWTDVATECTPYDGILYQWNYAGVPNGAYYLRITATNACGLTNSDITTVTVARGGYCECLGDLDGSGVVGFSDLMLLLSRWGACPLA